MINLPYHEFTGNVFTTVNLLVVIIAYFLLVSEISIQAQIKKKMLVFMVDRFLEEMA